MDDERFSQYIVRFQRYNQKLQASNRRLSLSIFHRIYNLICFIYGCYLPINVQIGKGFRTPHGLRGVYVAGGTVIGKKVTLLHQVTIGSNYFIAGAEGGPPMIEDDVFIGVGAKIIGPIKVGAGSRIGANATVVRDIPPQSTVVPAAPRIILQ